MKTKYSCPLGSECEKIVDDHIEKCVWYVKLAGMNPQTGEEMDEEKCAMAWMPLMMTEVAGTNRGQTSALESMRNEQVKGHEEFMEKIDNNNNRRAIGNE